MIHADRKPSDILTREAFINAIRVNSALGGSTNAPLHLIALARHIGVDLTIDDWQTFGYEVPLLVNLQPAGNFWERISTVRRRPGGSRSAAEA